MSNQTETENLLQKVEQELVVSYIPVIILLVLMVLIGIPGNSTAAAYFFRKRDKSSTEMFIMVLAFVDLIVSLFIVFYIYEVSSDSLNVTHGSICKAVYFLIHGTIGLSVLIVCAIAVDRFIKLYLPANRHIKSTTARYISVGLAVLSFLNSSLDIVTYDRLALNITVSNVTVEAHTCLNVRSEDLQWAIKASNISDIFFLSVVVLILLSTYTGIVYKLYSHRKRMNAREEIPLNAQESLNTSAGTSSRGSLKACESVRAKFNKNDTPSKYDMISAERNITLMMLCASVALSVCYVPYFIVNLIDFQGYEFSVWYKLAISSALLNSVINPIIYCLFTPKYRKFFKSLFTRCIQRSGEGLDSSAETREEIID